MKKFFSMVSLVLFLAMSNMTIAGGRAYVPRFRVMESTALNYETLTTIFVTNVSSSDISVTIDLYQWNGDMIHEDSQNPILGCALGAYNCTEPQAVHTYTFDLGAGEMGEMVLDGVNGLYGYGWVYWDSEVEQGPSVYAGMKFRNRTGENLGTCITTYSTINQGGIF